MAWTEVCKMQAVAQVDKRKEVSGSIRNALHELSKESEIPYGTLRDWYYQIKGVPKIRNTSKSDAAKETRKIADLHTMIFDSGRKKISFELVETDGNRLLAMQEYRIGRKAKEIPTKNRFAVTMDLIAQFRTALDQAVVIIQERCPVESGADVPEHGEDDQVELTAEADEGDTRENDSDGLGVEITPPPSSTDATEDATVEAELVQCGDCVHFAANTYVPEKNGACNSRSGSWNEPVFQPPNELHPCPNFQDGQPG